MHEERAATSLEEVLREIREVAKSTARGSLNTPQIRAIARRAGKSQRLAEELWATGIRDARIVASFVADPRTITRSTMDRWTRDFDSWNVCDACCWGLFDRSPYAWQKIPRWAAAKPEFVRRAAFATLAGLAVHDKAAEDQLFLNSLVLIEQYAFDDRNFVRKGVNWALRNIGKRNSRLLPAAVACAERVRAQNSRAARWIAADALREFRMNYGIP
jgi:3-methyladenine DNA glycosylase AlkD